MHNFHLTHIFIVCNMYIINNQVNVLALFDNYYIVLNCTAHFVYSPMNSYFIYIGYWTLNICYYYYSYNSCPKLVLQILIYSVIMFRQNMV